MMSQLPSASTPAPSRATRPLRDATRTHIAPRSLSSAAARSPSPPSPPVMAYEPDAARQPRVSELRPMQPRSRPAYHVPSRIESSGSVVTPVVTTAVRAKATPPAPEKPRPTSRLCARSAECSRRSTRANPQAPACALPDGPGERSEPTACAPHVSSSMRGVVPPCTTSRWASSRASTTPCADGAPESLRTSASAAARQIRLPAAGGRAHPRRSATTTACSHATKAAAAVCCRTQLHAYVVAPHEAAHAAALQTHAKVQRA